MNREIEAAIATLNRLGYSYCGGVLWKPPIGKAQQERKPHTEAEVQRIIFCAYETFGRKGFEGVVRETLGVPAP